MGNTVEIAGGGEVCGGPVLKSMSVCLSVCLFTCPSMTVTFPPVPIVTLFWMMEKEVGGSEKL